MTSTTIEPIDFTQVRIDDEFWSPRLETLREVTIEYVYEQLEETGRIDNFRIAAGEEDEEFNGRFYNDSDVYKWLEAACYLLARDPDDDSLRDRVDEVVAAIESAQEESGYLNTYFTIEAPDGKWTNLGLLHELYCAGHLFEAAVAHYRATDSERLLDVARRFADHIDEVFGPDARDGAPGHQEIELALVKLYRVTGEERYLDLAQFFLEQRGPGSRLEWEANHPEEIEGEVIEHALDENGEYNGRYFQDHAPVREQETVEGHAVRAMYLYAGMADVALEGGDEGYVDTLEQLWDNMTRKRMYVTGGIGSAHQGERFTEDYHLPNDTAYAETCAALGSVLWNQRMFRLTGDGRFADVLERTLYNGVLAGVSLEGDRFFYVNPLEIHDSDSEFAGVDEPRLFNQRQEWFGTACCPTNVPRLLASLGGYIYHRDTAEDDLYVNLYIGSHTEIEMDGTSVEIGQQTEYPWDGSVEIDVEPDEPVAFGLRLRIPDSVDLERATIGGEPVDVETRDGYAVFDREWTGETVELDVGMPAKRLSAHPAVRSDAGRVALQRGPIVYCLEETDNPRPLHQLRLPKNPGLTSRYDPDFLNGAVVIRGEADVPALDGWEDALYRETESTDGETVEFRAVPYHLWGHREPGDMQVWIRSEST